MIMGMQTMLLAGAEDLPALPPSYVDEFLNYGGGAYGNVTYDPGVTSYFAMVDTL